jgi:RNA polymerase sigma-70 factor, ECF subfamily
LRLLILIPLGYKLFSRYLAIDKNIPTIEKLFHELFKPLCGFSMKYVGDLDEAKELVHEAFIALWEKIDSLPQDANFRSYLYTAVRNKSLNYNRDKKKHVLIDHVPEHVLSEENDHLVTKELELEIEMAIQSLPEKCRIVFELNRMEGLKYSQIAEKMAISVKTVEAHMSKALSVLRERLGQFLSLLLFLIFK